MTDRAFRFGVLAGWLPDVGAVTRTARRAEELGYDTMLSPDPAGRLDPLTLLAAGAAVTDRLHFGTFVAAEPFREPQELIWQAQTLQNLSGGRFELGLGTGRPAAEATTAALGRTFGTAGERIARLGELVAAIRKEEPRLPLLLAGAGPKMLALAAKDADTVTFTWRPQTTEAEAAVVVDRFREIAGGRADEIELNLNLMAVGQDLSTEVQPYMGVSMAGLAEMGAISALTGDPDECVAKVRQLRADLGFTYFTVNAQYMEQFAPVVEALHGT